MRQHAGRCSAGGLHRRGRGKREGRDFDCDLGGDGTAALARVAAAGGLVLHPPCLIVRAQARAVRTALVAIAVTQSLACGPRSGGRTRLTGEDRGGVTWAIGTAPALRIGADSSVGVVDFGRVAGALRLSDGSVVVADLDPPGILVFDATGRHRRTVGRAGSGPGEFRYPAVLRPMPEGGFLAVDTELRRVTFFSEEAELVTTRRWPLQVAEAVLFPVGAISTERFIGTLTASRRPERLGERVRAPVTVVLGQFGAEAFQPVVRVPGDEIIGGVYREHGVATTAAYPLEFGDRTLVAASSELIYVGQRRRPRIDVFDTTGRKLRTISWAAARDPVTEADRQARIAQESAAAAGVQASPDPGQTWSATEHLRTVRLPAVAPAFTALMPAVDGDLWVEIDPRPWAPARQYLVFDAAGRLIARASLPRALEPFQVGRDFVLGRWRESGGPDEVRLYSLGSRTTTSSTP